MGPAYFVIAILGCADGGSACTPVTTLQTRYASEQQCVAATAAAVMQNDDLDYPTIIARCRAADTKAADAQEKRDLKKRRG